MIIVLAAAEVKKKLPARPTLSAAHKSGCFRRDGRINNPPLGHQFKMLIYLAAQKRAQENDPPKDAERFKRPIYRAVTREEVIDENGGLLSWKTFRQQGLRFEKCKFTLTS
jgi:hypothetical protein